MGVGVQAADRATTRPVNLLVSPDVLPASASADEIHPVGQDPELLNYRLAWHDEFDQPGVDTDRWIYRTDSKLLSKQLPANVSVSAGALHVSLRREDSGGKHYTGGGVISRESFEYGYYECRLRCPAAAGWHAAFWAMKYDGQGTGTAAGLQEIDFLEQDAVKPDIWTAGLIDWGHKGVNVARKFPDAGAKLCDNYHVWGCQYTPTLVRFFFDGSFSHGGDVSKVTRGPQQIWLSCINTGTGGKARADAAALPDSADFDYVRYFKAADDHPAAKQAPAQK